jgi:hypothetical protein
VNGHEDPSLVRQLPAWRGSRPRSPGFRPRIAPGPQVVVASYCGAARLFRCALYEPMEPLAGWN